MSPTERRVGFTVASISGMRTQGLIDAVRAATEAGASSLWTAETTGLEAFSTLASLAPFSGDAALGTGVIPLQLRTPLLTAQAAATLQAFHPDRDIYCGYGISSPVVVGRWHGARYGDRPMAEARRFTLAMRSALEDERSPLRVRLGDRRPKLVLGALNDRMLALAGELADGVLLNYLPASAVRHCVEVVRAAEADAGRSPGSCRIMAYVHVGVCDPDESRPFARKDLYSYAVVEGYARAFTRAGYGDEIAALTAARAAGDRDAAIAAMSDRMCDDIDLCSDASAVTGRVQAYLDAGVDEAVVMVLPWGADRAGVIAQTIDAAIGALNYPPATDSREERS